VAHAYSAWVDSIVDARVVRNPSRLESKLIYVCCAPGAIRREGPAKGAWPLRQDYGTPARRSFASGNYLSFTQR